MSLARLHAQAMSAHEGILRGLLSDEETAKRDGDHEDACFVLRNVIVRQSSHIKPKKYNVLATVNANSFDDLLNVISDAIEGNESEDFGLLIPVCCGRSHWCVVELEIQESQITQSKLWDPKGKDSDALRSTPAYINLQKVVNDLNGSHQTPVAAVKADVQPDDNSHSCMDYCVQHIFQSVGVKNGIADAQSDVELRYAMIDEIRENHPAILKQKVDQQDSYEFFSRPENKEAQIKLDELMAIELQKSLNELTEADARDKETPLFEKARKHVYGDAALLKRLGVMAKPMVETRPVLSVPVTSSNKINSQI
jgi:hypothetical protein